MLRSVSVFEGERERGKGARSGGTNTPVDHVSTRELREKTHASRRRRRRSDDDDDDDDDDGERGEAAGGGWIARKKFNGLRVHEVKKSDEPRCMAPHQFHITAHILRLVQYSREHIRVSH